MSGKSRAEAKFSVYLAEAFLVILLGAILANAPAFGAEKAYIFGLEGWYSSGDTIQFVGDANQKATLVIPDCDLWHDDCRIDKGFAFREVSGVNTTTCAIADSADTCYVFAVVCCYWMGDCSEHPCNMPGHAECWETEDNCGKNCYCWSIWEVRGFDVAPGDEEPPDLGCYEIEKVCDIGETDPCDADVCGTKVAWYDR